MLNQNSRSPLSIIFITIFIDLLGFGLVLPALPFYAESYGASPLMVGFLSMSYSLMQFIFSPLWGRISDRIGRRPIILWGLAGSCASFAVFGFAQSLPLLFLGRALSGLATGATLPAGQAYIADITTPENRARGMGLIGAAFGLGFIFGPSVGGLLSKWGYGVPALVAAGLAGLNFIWAWFQLPETLHHSKRGITPHYLSPASLRTTFSNGRLVFLFALLFLIVFAFANMESTFALFSEHQVGLKAFGVGLLLGEVGVVAAFIQGLMIGKLTRKFGEVRLAQVGIIVMSIGLFVTALVYTGLGMALVVPLYAFGSALTNPTLMALLSKSESEERQGLTLGTAQGLAALARVLGPLWGTWVFQEFSPHAPYIGASVVLLVAWIAAMIWLKRMTAQPVMPALAEA